MLGFLLRADVRRSTADWGDDGVLPVAWSDDDVMLWLVGRGCSRRCTGLASWQSA